jgi:hypothetical protein
MACLRTVAVTRTALRQMEGDELERVWKDVSVT